ncbi:unnamed protein product [Lactuca saligna]|uniref:Uncharacterized protein n=1 Tax=Lactuca saligna TaxID=75948 RepID=A0AA35YRK9_LACSI|nr:unnamed protein product [Lactuca saligna]
MPSSLLYSHHKIKLTPIFHRLSAVRRLHHRRFAIVVVRRLHHRRFVICSEFDDAHQVLEEILQPNVNVSYICYKALVDFRADWRCVVDNLLTKKRVKRPDSFSPWAITTNHGDRMQTFSRYRNKKAKRNFGRKIRIHQPSDNRQQHVVKNSLKKQQISTATLMNLTEPIDLDIKEVKTLGRSQFHYQSKKVKVVVPFLHLKKDSNRINGKIF